MRHHSGGGEGLACARRVQGQIEALQCCSNHAARRNIVISTMAIIVVVTILVMVIITMRAHLLSTARCRCERPRGGAVGSSGVAATGVGTSLLVSSLLVVQHMPALLTR